MEHMCAFSSRLSSDISLMPHHLELTLWTFVVKMMASSLWVLGATAVDFERDIFGLHKITGLLDQLAKVMPRSGMLVMVNTRC